MPEALHFQIDEYYLDLQKQGQDMEIMDRDATQQNPFPGLRPFRTAEAHLFFGREGQAEALIGRLMQTHFLGVLGNSGSGKSSLVRAGLIPALRFSLLVPPGTARGSVMSPVAKKPPPAFSVSRITRRITPRCISMITTAGIPAASIC